MNPDDLRIFHAIYRAGDKRCSEYLVAVNEPMARFLVRNCQPGSRIEIETVAEVASATISVARVQAGVSYEVPVLVWITADDEIEAAVAAEVPECVARHRDRASGEASFFETGGSAFEASDLISLEPHEEIAAREVLSARDVSTFEQGALSTK